MKNVTNRLKKKSKSTVLSSTPHNLFWDGHKNGHCKLIKKTTKAMQKSPLTTKHRKQNAIVGIFNKSIHIWKMWLTLTGKKKKKTHAHTQKKQQAKTLSYLLLLMIYFEMDITMDIVNWSRKPQKQCKIYPYLLNIWNKSNCSNDSLAWTTKAMQKSLLTTEHLKKKKKCICTNNNFVWLWSHEQ